jgi:hypothetical protein
MSKNYIAHQAHLRKFTKFSILTLITLRQAIKMSQVTGGVPQGQNDKKSQAK